MTKLLKKVNVDGDTYYLYKESNWVSAFKGKKNKSRSNFVVESGAKGNTKKEITQVERYLNRRKAYA